MKNFKGKRNPEVRLCNNKVYNAESETHAFVQRRIKKKWQLYFMNMIC